jgi:hypothetical protein
MNSIVSDRLACDKGSWVIGHRMSDQKFTIASFSVLRKHVKLLIPAEKAVVSSHQSTLGPRGGLWPVLLVCLKTKARNGLEFRASIPL